MMGGGFNVSGSASLSGSGVTFFLTKGLGYNYGPLSVSGSVQLTLSAPTAISSPYYGILFFQDRTVPTGSPASSISGSSNFKIDGTFYFPTTALSFSGSSSAGNYLLLVADTLSITGSSLLKLNQPTGRTPFEPPVSVTVSPTTASLKAGQTQQFTATLGNSSEGVTWSVMPTGAGTINASGLYTAPPTISAQQTVTVTATSQEDPTKSAPAMVTLLPSPILVSVTPNSGQQGTSNLSVTVTGTFTHFSSSSVVTFANTAVTAGTSTAATLTTLTIPVSITAAASLGATNVTVTTGTEVVTFANAFTVTAGTSVITQVNPNSGQQGASNVPITITGNFTHFSTSSVVTFGNTAVTAAPPSAATLTSVTVPVSIAAAAALGPTSITVTTGAEVVTLTNAFTVNNGTPGLLSVNPNSGQQGQQNESVTMTGQFTHWAQGTSIVSFGAGVTVASLTINSPTSATAVLNIDPAAATGARNVTVTTNTEVVTLTNGFTVNGVPVLTQVSPTSGPQGQQNLSVAISGQSTHFLQGTSQANFGAGITVASLTVNSPTSATAVLNIDPATTTGPRAVTLTTGTEVATLTNGFAVTTGAPALLSASPSSGQQGQQNLSVTITGQFTHFSQGTTAASFGGGITVVSLTVSSPTSATALLNIDPAAATGARTITLTTGTEIDTLTNGFTVTAGTPITLSINPNSGQQGQQNLSVTLTGVASHFAQGSSQANFGAGVTVTSLTVSSPTTATATLNIDPAASAGARTVTMATGGEIGTLNNGFNVLASAPSLLSLSPNSGQAGQQSLPVVIAGQFTHFAQGTTQASFGAGITVTSLTVSSTTSATAIINIDPAAAGGARTVTLTTGAETPTLANGFAVTPSTPVLLSVTPNTGQQGQNVPVTLTGQFTHFAQGTSQASLGAGITVNSLTVNSPTTAAALLNIDYSAAGGARTASLTTGTETATLNNAFTVTVPSPLLQPPTPKSGQQGQQSLSVVITGQFTHFAQGTTLVNLGAGITVASVTVSSFTSATALINIDPAAAAGTRTLTVTTGTEVVTLANAFTVSSAAIGISATPNPWNFGNVPVTTSAKQTFTIMSTGQSALTVNSITIAGAFFTLGNLPTLPLVLSPSGTSTFTVTYAPQGTFLSAATVTINSNAASSPTTVSLSGTGTPPPLPPAAAITVSTNQQVYRRVQPVLISGSLTSAGGMGISNIPVTVQVSINGSPRTFNPYTDSQGNYSATFQPGPTDGGTFSVTATASSGGATQSATTSFRIFGLFVNPASLTQNLVMGNSLAIPLNLQNVGDAALNNIAYLGHRYSQIAR